MANDDEAADANSAEEQDQIARSAAELLLRLPPVYNWPDDIREELLEKFTVRSRLCLIPAYRKERIGGLSESISSTYLMLASGSGVTDSGGSASIDVDSLLFSVRQGQYMHSGIHPWVGQDTTGARIDTVPFDPVAVGVPHTVVTGTGDSPAIFTTTNQRIEATKAGDLVVLSWFSPAAMTGKSAGSVQIRSFDLRWDGILRDLVRLAHLYRACVWSRRHPLTVKSLPGSVTMQGLGEVTVREIHNKSMHFPGPGASAKDRAVEGLQFLQDNGRYWPR